MNDIVWKECEFIAYAFSVLELSGNIKIIGNHPFVNGRLMPFIHASQDVHLSLNSFLN